MDLPWYCLLLVFLPPLVLGATILRCARIRPVSDPLAYLGWTYVTGMLATATLLFLWVCLGLPPKAWLLHLVLLATATLAAAPASQAAALQPDS